MRGSLVIVCAGLAGVALVGCSKKKDDPAPSPSAGATGATAAGARGGGERTDPGGAAPGGVVTGGAPEGAQAGGSPGATGPDPSFELSTTVQPAAAGATTTARLVVHPGPGLKMNTDFPTGLTLSPPAGVTVSKASWAPSDAEKFDTKELTFAVPLSAAAAGEYKVPGTFKFAVCDEGACYPKKRAVELVLNVQ